jgi:hypothetical protein
VACVHGVELKKPWNYWFSAVNAANGSIHCWVLRQHALACKASGDRSRPDLIPLSVLGWFCRIWMAFWCGV